MSGPYFSSRDQDEYDASQMSLKSLEWQTQDHPADCDCAFCEAKERRRADENDEPETPPMPKIGTPEDFYENKIMLRTGREIIEALTARDAAIRNESAELLRTCGEALKGVRTWVRPVANTEIAVDAALAALGDIGKKGIGVRCGCCGKWIPDQADETGTGWGLCGECANDKEQPHA